MPYLKPSTQEPPPRAPILLGGMALACTAGYVNVVVLGTFAVPVSHMTGAFSRLGVDIAEGNSLDLALTVLIVTGFLAGAVLSGAIIVGNQLKPGRHYGIALMLEAVALGGATALLRAGSMAGVPVAAFACGIQNGMASSYYGLILRTTHVTGIVTDLGVLLGQRLRGRRMESWKPVMLAGLLVGFLLGCMAGQKMVAFVGPGALGLAAVVTFVAGAGYFRWRSRSSGAAAPGE